MGDEEDNERDDGVDLGAEVGRGRHGTSAVYTNIDGVKTVVSQAEHYAWRSAGLHSMSFIEFVMGLKVAKLTPVERDTVKAAMEGATSAGDGLRQAEQALNPAHAGAGRRAGFKYLFWPRHALHDSYCLQARAKFDVPVLIGDPPPRAPSPGGKGRGHTRRALDHSEYFCALFVPWFIAEEEDQTCRVHGLHAGVGDDGQLAQQEMSTDGLVDQWDDYKRELSVSAWRSVAANGPSGETAGETA